MKLVKLIKITDHLVILNNRTNKRQQLNNILFSNGFKFIFLSSPC